MADDVSAELTGSGAISGTIVGGESNDDTIHGGSGGDRNFSGANNDTLVCGAGEDTLLGGQGADAFVFNAVSDSPHGGPRDTITDFEPDGDMAPDFSVDLTGPPALTEDDLIL